MAARAALAKRESTDDRRRAIAAAARALIVERGFEGLRTRDIAERVGINIATLHYHVPSKEALIGLVCETMKDDFRAQPLARPRDHLPAADQLEHEFGDFWEILTDKRELLALMSELTERARRDPVIAASVRPLMGKWLSIITGILEQGRSEGSFRSNLDATPAALMLMGALIGYARGPEVARDSFERLCAELRRAIANPAAKPPRPPG
jgi:AcrR family transcriptional regulator